MRNVAQTSDAVCFCLQKETFYSVMQVLQSFKQDNWDALYSDGNLDRKDAVALNKYITVAYEMLTSKDQSKFPSSHVNKSSVTSPCFRNCNLRLIRNA